MVKIPSRPDPGKVWPVLLTIGGLAIAIEHVSRVETQALESHKTILVHTTSGAIMFHDQTAIDVARAFGLRPAAEG